MLLVLMVAAAPCDKISCSVKERNCKNGDGKNHQQTTIAVRENGKQNNRTTKSNIE